MILKIVEKAERVIIIRLAAANTILKTTKVISLFILILIISSCSSTKDKINNKLFRSAWELEFISGPRITFSGLYPDKKPIIKFNQTSNQVEGTDSCNGYMADYTLNGTEIAFGEPGLSTMMFCGQGEKLFRDTIRKINKYKIDEDGKLNLMIDDIPMMRFKKSQ